MPRKNEVAADEDIDYEYLHGPAWKETPEKPFDPYTSNIQTGARLHQSHHCAMCGPGPRKRSCFKEHSHLAFCAACITVIKTVTGNDGIWARHDDPNDFFHILDFDRVGYDEYEAKVRTRCGHEFAILSGGCHEHPYSNSNANVAYKLKANGKPIQMSMFDDPEPSDIPEVVTRQQKNLNLLAEAEIEIENEYEAQQSVSLCTSNTYSKWEKMKLDEQRSRKADQVTSKVARSRRVGNNQSDNVQSTKARLANANFKDRTNLPITPRGRLRDDMGLQRATRNRAGSGQLLSENQSPNSRRAELDAKARAGGKQKKSRKRGFKGLFFGKKNLEEGATR